jgi:hypothetical protein
MVIRRTRVNSMGALLAIAALLFGAPGCTSAGSRETASSTANGVGGQAADKDAHKEVDEKPSQQEKLEKKEYELVCARLELDIAKQAVDGDEREAKANLVQAEFKLQRAVEDRDNYKNVESALATSETDLHLEEAKERLEESRQEMAELEKMYKKETFAEITKELVLVRGKVRVKMAEKGLELAQKKATQQREFEIPKKTKELGQSVEKAQLDVDAARLKLARFENEKKLKLAKAERSITEIERAIAKLKSSKDDKEAKS